MFISASTEPAAFDPFIAYWKEIQAIEGDAQSAQRDAARVPLRRDFNPMKIHQLLPFIYIVEWNSRDDVVIRICGTGLEERFGKSLKGANYFKFCSPDQRPFFSILVEAVIHHPCALEVSRNVEMEDGTTREFSSLNLPLADDEGNPRFIVGMMNITRKAPFGKTKQVGNARSIINKYGYIDIGFGTPPLPAKPVESPT